MDNHRDYSPLERPRLLENGSGGSGTGGSTGAGGGSHMPSVSELAAARAATPTTLTTLTQFHSRYGMSSAVPSPNLALMSGLFTGAHSSDTRKTLLPDFHHYWNAQTESFPRYLMTGGLYPPYTSLLPGTAESLSLFGAGVACVTGGAAPGVGPSQSHHMTNYQRLFEIQKDLSREAYLVSMSANHPTHLYGIGTNTMSPFLDQTVVSSHSATPLSLVKQEPREQSGVEKTTKQGDRRTNSLKVDVDLNRRSRESSPFPTSAGHSQSPQIKEPKLSPPSPATARKSDKKSSNSSVPQLSNNGFHNMKNTSSQVSGNSGSFSKPRPDSRSSKPNQARSSVHSPQNSNNSNATHNPGSKKSGSKSSVVKQLQTSNKASSLPSSSLLVESPVISVPTKAAAPIPLATVQHDGVLLSALASPTSAAASSISAKSSILKQQADRLNRSSTAVRRPAGAEKVASVLNTCTSNGLSDLYIDTTQNCDYNTSANHSNTDRRKNTNSSSITMNTNGVDKCSPTEDSKLFSDDSSDIVVDSTENDDVPTIAESVAFTKSEHERAVEETIERVASATTDSDVESDQEDVYLQGSEETKSSSTSLLRVANLTPSSKVTTTSSPTGTRTVHAKTQPVLSVAVSGNIPVGIAVAQIRPQYIQQHKEAQSSHTRDTRHGHTTASSKTMTTATASLVAAAPTRATSLVVAGPTVNTSPWLPQMSFPLPQAMKPSGTTFDPSFPISAPSGFKFAHDSISGRVFLIPTEDFVEQGGVWPPPSFVPPTTTLNLPTITVSGAEKREGRPITEGNQDKNVSPANTSVKNIPAAETFSKEILVIDDGKHNVLTQSLVGSDSSSSQGLAAGTTVLVNPVTNGSSSSPSVLVKLEQPTFESRGCSPIIFEDVPSRLSILSALSCLTSEKQSMCTVGVQTCDSLIRSSYQRKSSPQKRLSHDQGVQTLSHEFSTLHPLSVQCPDLDSVCPLTNSHGNKVDPDRVSYNPFTDPQILQAADGLELLSTLAEKRPKCSSIDDPKRIFPSPSDSFKSDSASLVAVEDTLSPGDMEFKSGQCTPRREHWRDLSPKWSHPKKELPSLSGLGDFKAPSELECHDDSEMKIKLAEVQRQYKKKQKELAKLQNKKTEESKQSKRGPGRPPKNRTLSKKSDNESSSSSSKNKDQQPQKKKRPAEELVDRVFRKLPPVIKPLKGSRSIHYVKSKTGPFFRRKSASSSVKQNKDLFGFDESTWPSFSERKHQEKVKCGESVNGKSKNRHRSSSSFSEDSKYSQDAGNIFSNLESFGGEFVKKTSQSQENIERKNHQPRFHSPKLEKLPPSASGPVVIKTEMCSASSHEETDLGLLATFALNASIAQTSSCSATTLSTRNTSVTISSTSTVSSQSSSPFCSTNITNLGNGSYNNSSSRSIGHTPGITFGSVSSFMTSATSSMMSFNSAALAVSSAASATILASPLPRTTPLTSTTSLTSSPPTTSSLTLQLSTSTIPSTAMLKPQFTLSETQPTTIVMSNNGLMSNTACKSETATSNSGNIILNSAADFNRTSISPLNIFISDVGDTSPYKRKFEEDSDTDASDTSINKKRKPGRPRKMNPEKSSCATETIWAKKSSSAGLSQVLPEPGFSLSKDGDGKKMDLNVMKPLFLDEEWTRRRSERIFLSEPSPQPSPAISPTPRGEPVWKLSNFMPKSKKLLDVNKSIKEGEQDKVMDVPTKDQPTTSNVAPTKASPLSASSKVTVKTEGKESVLWTASNKDVEVSTLKVEDAKKIIKLEDVNQSLPLSMPEKSKRNSKVEDTEKKKMSKKSITKIEASPTLSLSPPTLEMKVRRAEENSKIKLQKAKSLHDLTQRVKKKFSKASGKKQEDNQLKSTSKSKNKKRKCSTDSSDTDNLPLVSLRANPPTPVPCTCKLQQSDLREGLKVLYFVDGLFHEGTVKALQPPDVYGVLTAGQRGNRPHILCQEEILKWAVLDVKPGSLRCLPEGTRICAFWSQQFSCLYPGTVAKSSTINNNEKKVVVPVEFDDGDNGRIELDHIRLLPSDFPIVEYEPDPLEALPKRKQRSTSDASERRKSMDVTEPKTNKQSKETADIDIDDDNSESSDEEKNSNEKTGNVARKLWKWEGKSTKKPGLKGKAKKVFYRAISRGKETIKVGDSAIFVSKERVNCPYIGHIESLWEGWNGQMMVRVQWYYHPEETESDKKLSDPRNALFESQHEDENDVQTIAHKCDVLSYAQYKKRLTNVSKKGRSLKSNVFYVAGFYDPTAKEIKFQPGVS